MKNRLCGIILILFLLSVIPIIVKAQTGSSARLSTPAIESFPQIDAYLDVKDSQGDFVHGLQTNHVEVLENGRALPVSSIEELRSGVQVVVALNPGPTFGVRNSQGISRYDYIKEALRNWANSRQGSTIDDWNLLITDGPTISHVNDPTEWLRALALDQVDARTATPLFDLLFQAITLASDTTSRPGMGRAVLFVTPPIEGQDILSIDNIVAQTEQLRIPIHIWMVASPGAYSAQSLEFLEQIAVQTGGEFFIYTGEEALPNPEEYLEPLRYTYFLSYDSAVKSSGTHEVSVRIMVDGERVESNAQNFDLDILPPKPAFVSPPLKIDRILTSPDPIIDSESPAEVDWEPKEQNLQVIFDFPDGRKRDLTRSSLLVNGVVVDENTEPPFDQFTWDIREYRTGSDNILQVQVTDVLGLSGSSIEIPVQISVEQFRSNPWAVFQKNIPFIVALAILLIGAVILLILIMGRRLTPSTLNFSLRQTGTSSDQAQTIKLQSESSASIFPAWAGRFKWSHGKTPTQTEAVLIPISNSDNSYSLIPIPITSDSLSIGSDPEQVTISLDDPSIEPLHSLIKRDSEGSFQIIDQGSIAGTWVNYTPILEEGVRLEHGDQIHIGRIGFVFTFRDPTHIRKPVITSESQPDEQEEIAT